MPSEPEDPEDMNFDDLMKPKPDNWREYRCDHGIPLDCICGICAGLFPEEEVCDD